MRLNTHSGNNLLQLARQRKAKSVIAYLDELGFGVQPKPAQQQARSPAGVMPQAKASASSAVPVSANNVRIEDIVTKPVAADGGCNSSSPLAPQGLQNLALQGVAKQISTASYGGFRAKAQFAIDGDTNGKYSQKSVTHTMSQLNPWWAVDLGANHEIDRIVVWNRTDLGVQKRLQNFSVYVLDEKGLPVFSQGYCQNGFPNPALAIAMPTAIRGRYVKIMLNGRNYLHLAEVQVFGR